MKTNKTENVPTFSQNLTAYIREYCKKTTMHGFRYLTEPQRLLIERIWWIALLCISFIICVMLTNQAFQKWMQSPIVITFPTRETPVWEIPFPAVTICPQIKSSKAILNYTAQFLKHNHNEMNNTAEEKNFLFMSMACSKNVTPKLYLNDTVNGDEFHNFLYRTQPMVTYFIESCFWMEHNCTSNIAEWFTPLVTIEGICFSFNLLDRTDLFSEQAWLPIYENFYIPNQPKSTWSDETGYVTQSIVNSYPKRTTLNGVHGGLTLTLRFDSSQMDYLCGDAFKGFKFILDSPSNFPLVQQDFFRVGVDQDVNVALKPQIASVKELQKYSVSKRGCNMKNDHTLRFFKEYNQNNCLHECLANITMEYCNCAWFSMMRTKDCPVCGAAKLKCMREAAVKNVLFQTDNVDENGAEILGQTYRKCNCLPTCSWINFEKEISKEFYEWREIYNVYNKTYPSSFYRSRVQIFYKTKQFMASSRSELYETSQFIASCGGLIGLFMGLSFMTVVEIVYYATLRIIGNIIRYGRHNWAGTQLKTNQIL